MFLKKLKKAMAKKEPATAERLRENQPVFNLDHVVKERCVCKCELQCTCTLLKAFLIHPMLASPLISLQIPHLC